MERYKGLVADTMDDRYRVNLPSPLFKSTDWFPCEKCGNMVGSDEWNIISEGKHYHRECFLDENGNGPITILCASCGWYVTWDDHCSIKLPNTSMTSFCSLSCMNKYLRFIDGLEDEAENLKNR